MTKTALLALLVAMAAGGMARGGDTKKGPLQTLVETERAFAKMSVDRNHREAFLAYFGDDGVLMRPGATNAKAWINEHAQWGTKGLLTWDPSFGAVSETGDLGYTTGPWEYRTERSLDAKPVAWGYFITVWTQTPDGWRVAFDQGSSNPEPTEKVEPFHPKYARPAIIDSLLPPDTAKMRDDLMKADADFRRAVADGGASKAYAAALDDKGRVHRADKFPALGKKAALAVVATDPTGLTFEATGGDTSTWGDLGYVYGTVSKAGADPGDFLRIWRKDLFRGRWRIVLDLLNPPTPPAK
jgi:ketosteroid isomerase-like protein